MLKEYNFLHTTALYNSFNTPTMTVYQHLVNLDFVRKASSPATSFGRIPVADIRFPHLQIFYRLVHEFFRVGRLRGSSGDNHFPLFNAPNLSAGLESYKKTIDWCRCDVSLWCGLFRHTRSMTVQKRSGRLTGSWSSDPNRLLVIRSWG